MTSGRTGRLCWPYRVGTLIGAGKLGLPTTADMLTTYYWLSKYKVLSDPTTRKDQEFQIWMSYVDEVISQWQSVCLTCVVACSFKKLCQHLFGAMLSAWLWEQAAAGPIPDIAPPRASWFSAPCERQSFLQSLMASSAKSLRNAPRLCPSSCPPEARKTPDSLNMLSHPDNTTAGRGIYCSKLNSYPIQISAGGGGLHWFYLPPWLTSYKLLSPKPGWKAPLSSSLLFLLGPENPTFFSSPRD